jgi:hypothetical protein
LAGLPEEVTPGGGDLTVPSPSFTMNEANIIFAILAIAFALRFAWLELSGQ